MASSTFNSLLLSMQIFIGVSFALWILVTLLLYRQHKKFRTKRRKGDKFLQLEPDLDEEGRPQHLYLVSFFTGSHYKRPPSGAVQLHLLGSLYPGKFHNLAPPTPDPPRLSPLSPTLFPPRAREKFIIAEDVPLGRIQSLVLQTEVVGRHPYWECQSVIVRDLQSQSAAAWFFSAPPRTKIGWPPVLLQASAAVELVSFGFSWHRRVRREVRQGGYIYFGFWFKPFKSVYSYWQRVSVAVTTQFHLFSIATFLLGVVFSPVLEFHAPPTAGNASSGLQPRSNLLKEPGGNYWFSHAIVIGFTAALIASFTGHLLVTLFRQKSKYETKVEEMDHVMRTAMREEALNRHRRGHGNAAAATRACGHHDSILGVCQSTISVSSPRAAEIAAEEAIRRPPKPSTSSLAVKSAKTAKSGVQQMKSRFFWAITAAVTRGRVNKADSVAPLVEEAPKPRARAAQEPKATEVLVPKIVTLMKPKEEKSKMTHFRVRPQRLETIEKEQGLEQKLESKSVENLADDAKSEASSSSSSDESLIASPTYLRRKSRAREELDLRSKMRDKFLGIRPHRGEPHVPQQQRKEPTGSQLAEKFKSQAARQPERHGHRRKFFRPLSAWVALLLVNLLSISLIVAAAIVLISEPEAGPVHGGGGQEEDLRLQLYMFATTYLTALVLGTLVVETGKMALIGIWYAWRETRIRRGRRGN